MKKESNNKGFSLVELIIVVAIMAILMVVLAPTFTKYVDRSRQSSDASSVAGIVSAMETGLADATDYEHITDGKYIVTIDAGTNGAVLTVGASAGDSANSIAAVTPNEDAKKDMEKAITDACGDMKNIKRTAKAWSTDIKITADVTGGVMKVTYEPKNFAEYINKEVTPAAGT